MLRGSHFTVVAETSVKLLSSAVIVRSPKHPASFPRPKHYDIGQSRQIELARLQDIELALDQIQFCRDTGLDHPWPVISGVEADDKNPVVLEAFRELLQDRQDLSVRYVIEGFTEKYYVEFLGRTVAQKIGVDEAVLLGSTALLGTPHGLCQSGF